MNPKHISEDKDNDDEKWFLYAMQLVSGSVFPMVLKSAIELDILEIIARGGGGSMSAKEIASNLKTNNPEAAVLLDRILCLLSSYSVLTCSSRSLPDGKIERLYCPGPVCKYLTKNERGVSLSAYSLLRQDKLLMENWSVFYSIFMVALVRRIRLDEIEFNIFFFFLFLVM